MQQRRKWTQRDDFPPLREWEFGKDAVYKKHILSRPGRVHNGAIVDESTKGGWRQKQRGDGSQLFDEVSFFTVIQRAVSENPSKAQGGDARGLSPDLP